MDERTITKTIRTELSDAAMAGIAREAAAKQQLINQMESELTAVTKARKADIAKVQAEFDGLIKLAGDGCREEEMEVIERFDIARGVATWLHPETMEVLGERELTDKEKGGPIGELCGPRTFPAEQEMPCEECEDGIVPETGEPCEACGGTGTLQVAPEDQEEHDEAATADAASDGDDDEAEDQDRPTTLDWLLECAVSDVNFRMALERATIPELHAALDSDQARRTKSRTIALKRELRKRGRAVPPAETTAEHEPDARDPGYESPIPRDAPNCLKCGHTPDLHGDPAFGASGCMALGCSCSHYVHPDPLGVADFDPQAERGEASDATP